MLGAPKREERAAAVAALKLRVRDAVLQVLAEGRIPSERTLRERLPGVGAHALLRLRDELRDEGEVPGWPDGRNTSRATDGLTGETEAERQEIEARRVAELASMQRAWAAGLATRSKPGFIGLEGEATYEPRVHRYTGPRQRGRARP